MGRKYRAPDLVPAAGPERPIAFLIIGVPLAVIVLLGLVFGSGGSSALSSVPVLSFFFSSDGGDSSGATVPFRSASDQGRSGVGQTCAGLTSGACAEWAPAVVTPEGATRGPAGHHDTRAA